MMVNRQYGRPFEREKSPNDGGERVVCVGGIGRTTSRIAVKKYFVKPP